MIRKNFISADRQSAISSLGERFEAGEKVGHQDELVGDAVIISFEIDEESNEVKVNTSGGWAHLDFLVKF